MSLLTRTGSAIRAARSVRAGLAMVLAGTLVMVTTGCQDDAYCFTDCEELGDSGGGDAAGGSGASGGNLFNNTGGSTSTGEGGGCELTNAGVELCDNVDNDCDGDIDEETDFSSILTCGTCDNSCFAQLLNANPNTIVCAWDGTANTPGVCTFSDCSGDYFDVDGDGVDCEYYCVKTATDDSLCNNRDDDCDGVKDEDVDLCGDPQNCGTCGRNCVVAHGTGQCVDGGATPCTAANTQCEVGVCDDDDMDGSPDWWDADGAYANGCEYSCSLNPLTSGIEICGNGIDDDCDGAIDGADTDLSGDPMIGVTCFGDPDGLCATAAHAGTWDCVGQQYECVGPNVLVEGDLPEICNLDGAAQPVDDDCNGLANDNPIDEGMSCGVSAVYPCRLGTDTCINGVLMCLGNVDPQADVCDGLDNDCDGNLDSQAGGTASDAGGPCNVPLPPPAGSTSPCMEGALACSGGVLSCQGDIGPTSTIDDCNIDANCDGVLTGQPDTATDVGNCGMCGNDCYLNSLHKVFSCVGGMCQDLGCEGGFWDLDADPLTCEYGSCLVTGPEVCDGIDNDCNGTVDDVAMIPSPAQANCGVSPLATRPECTAPLVTVTCNSTLGQWECAFPVGVCDPDCASGIEVCDALDNDCDGGFNENVSGYGLPCKSDDGLPYPGDGACQTSGTFVCNGANATQCSAVKEDCANLTDGCAEQCDGIDNDCDGSVDETYGAPGSDATYFIQPAVTQIESGIDDVWITTYEVSRPDATPTTAGAGNGYHCANGCGALPVSPPGEPLDQTLGCSVPNRLPWFNVTPVEVEQTCDAIGGRICDFADWQLSCDAQSGCDWGYRPLGNCNTNAGGATFCNLSAFDFDMATVGLQDGLLPAGSPLLGNCSADWSGTFGNDLGEPLIFDITGNLREITKLTAGVYPLMGGAFNTQDEEGATCDFDFYVVDQDFALLDTGFRCCFDVDPTM